MKRKCIERILSVLAILSLFVTFQLMKSHKPLKVDDDLDWILSARKVHLKELLEWEKSVCTNFSRTHKKQSSANLDRKYLVTWYNINPYIRWRPEAWPRGFTSCKYNNCEMSLCKRSAEDSDAVIFDGRRLPKKYEYKRPVGQVWIFAEDETPYTYDYDGGNWRLEFWRHAFNWSMTYDQKTTDIHLTYGQIRKKNFLDKRDFLEIAKNKTRGAIIITSNCETKSKRLEYIKELQKYIDVDILGKCGREWDCGRRWIHDDCFVILNDTYKFYLAFENALCRDYRTEKFFENFNYDILLVARGGISKDDVVQPKDVYVSTSDFPDAESLGMYLSRLSNNVGEYAKLLERKSQYYFPGFQEVYQTALCTLCEKMNHQQENHRVIRDIETEVKDANPCRKPTDLTKTGFLNWLLGIF